MKPDFLREFEFFTGVPDSQLKPICNYLMHTYGISAQHIIAANEGNAVALAAGYHLSTGKIPVVYLQNSGIGNIINPVASLLNDEVYGIPVVFIVGWRGEPGIPDEPQHAYQGQVTLRLLEDMDIRTCVVDDETDEAELARAMMEFRPILAQGKSVAFVVKHGAFTFDEKVEYQNDHALCREEVIEHITAVSGEDIVVSTTGKTSRELFEIRERTDVAHRFDFLTVGSMGHSSSIALGISLNAPEKRVWCIDGDGAALMHLGAMAVIGANAPKNLIHVVLNNGAHESVGGMPTVADQVDFVAVAKGLGYKRAVSVDTFEALDKALAEAVSSAELTLIEVKTAIGSRINLGRPTIPPCENKRAFMTNFG